MMADYYWNLGMVNDVVADRAQNCAPQSSHSTSAHYNHVSFDFIGSTNNPMSSIAASVRFNHHLEFRNLKGEKPVLSQISLVQNDS